ncbi:isochorismatase [Skermanella aerolata]|uniref:Isochorismatase n=1 Tax=Skermanella aerolata TaxID=393310 RepID=A0A512DR18_9PROT|nr:hydrolase [Skermanella aerolata]KJB95203.1 isochorismatase hydrolase [Skermanella aerolata KACC 11604]GEO38942.1 isochorismatase [Skermanella aerolata]
MLLESQRSVLLVVDVQERLAPAIAGGESLLNRISTLLKAAAELDVPILATEQYSKGLGTTVEPLAGLLPTGSVVEKIHFNAANEPGFVERVRGLDRPQIVVTGTEAHVCVLQTTLGLRAAGFDCFLVADAVGSRDPENRHVAMERMHANGVEIVTSEMVMFEWLRRGSTPAFKRVLPLIR